MTRNQPPSNALLQGSSTALLILGALLFAGLVAGLIAARVGTSLTARPTDPVRFNEQYITTVAALYNVESSNPDQRAAAVQEAQRRLRVLSSDPAQVQEIVGTVAGRYQAFNKADTKDGRNVLALAQALNIPVRNVNTAPPPQPATTSPITIQLIVVLAIITFIVGIIWIVMIQRANRDAPLDPEHEPEGFMNRMMSRMRRIRFPQATAAQSAQPRVVRQIAAPQRSAPAAGSYAQQPDEAAYARQQQAPGAAAPSAVREAPEDAAEERQPMPIGMLRTNGSAAAPAGSSRPTRSGAGSAVDTAGEGTLTRSFYFNYRLGDEPYQPPFTIDGDQRGVMIASAGVDPGLRLSENPDRYCSFLIWLFDNSNEEGSSVALLSEWVDTQDMEEVDRWVQQTGPQYSVVATRGTLVRLETSTTVMEVICSSFSYGSEANFPPRSYFSELSLDLRVTVKG